MSNEQDHIQVNIEDKIMTLRINRLEKKNALTVAMYQTLADNLFAADENPDVRVVVLCGAPGCFTSGNDLMDFMQNPPSGDDSSVAQFLRAIATTKKPLCAIVDGIAIGVGTTMLLHCDLVYAGSKAMFKMPFVELGLCPEAASSLILPKLLGHVKASELILLSQPFNAEEAVRLGIANTAYESEEVEDKAMEKIKLLAAQAPESVRISKELLRGRDRDDIANAMIAEFEQFMPKLVSEEAAEAFQAFAEKRKPDFSRFS